ncbi:MAG: UV DNA damage repair endonuclease UvsE [Halanaerobium sp.]|nr:UV DNA damage repair endonuclease UvsE [Halanaerobium sp.]
MDQDITGIGFGYACISSLVKKCSTARTVSLKRFNQVEADEDRSWLLEKVARKNLENTLRLLWHNIAEGIRLYRFSSQLVPLGNHPQAQFWDFTEVLAEEFARIGKIVKKYGLRVSTHPGQYTVINSEKRRVYENAVLDLVYHDRVLRAMGLDNEAVMVLHVGGVYGDKEASLERFITNFRELPVELQERIVIENDDTSYSIQDVLYLCQTLSRPMVLDVHHHNCYNQGEELEDHLPEIFATWDGLARPPKVHFSSPKSSSEPLSHADYIEPGAFLDFVKLAHGYKYDVMVEAKKQDGAVLKLWQDIGYSGSRLEPLTKQ